MTTTLTAIRQSLKKFHRNEEGLEALQVVMIVAVAAIMLLFVRLNWDKIKTWFDSLMSQILGWKE